MQFQKEMNIKSQGAEDCAQCYASKFFGPDGPSGDETLSISYTVEAAREVVADELAIVLIWISLDDGPSRRCFMTETCVLTKGEGEWKRSHSGLQTVRRHELLESKL